MQKHLKSTDAKPVPASAEAGGVQVKSVSSTGNIKIALKSAPAAQTLKDAPKAKAGAAGETDLVKPSAATAGQAKSKVKSETVERAKAAVKTDAKLTKPSKDVTPQSLASASAQSDAAFALGPKSSQGSSLKPLGLAAAALGVIALGLGVLQFAGGTSDAVAQAEAAEDVVTADPSPVAVSRQSVATLEKIEPVVASVDANNIGAATEASAPETVAVADVVPSVDPDKAAVVAPQSVSVSQTVLAQTDPVDPMKRAIADAMATLGRPAAKAVAPEGEAATKPAPATETTAQAQPDVTQRVPAQDDLVVAAAAPRPADAAPVTEPVAEAGHQADLMARMTAGTLQALRSASAQTGQPRPSEAETKAAVSDLYQLVSEATRTGKSEAQIAVLLSEAHKTGQITVPANFVLANGDVDTQTILSLFIAH